MATVCVSMSEMAVIKPFDYDDPETGDKVAISVSERYSKLTINDREYYFIRETGEFDGTATTLKRCSPILVSDGGE
jgi:hypothetical protein